MEKMKDDPAERLCTACGDCKNICPTHAIRRWNGVFAINPLRCTNCGMCKEICPIGGPAQIPIQF